MTHWDKSKKENFQIISRRITFVPEDHGHKWHFSIDNRYNLYFDELALMIDYLQAINELRFTSNTTRPNASP